MKKSEFINREDEIDLLQTRFQGAESELIVIYGRRRIGKSALVREAIRDVDDAVYWQATEETPDAQITNFVETARENFPTVDDIQRDWEALLRELGRNDAIVVLDEFPYLVESDDALPSKIQRVWDMHLEDTAMTLVLVGSSISVMEEKVLAGGSPLYGRRTAAIDLPPLSLADAREFFPGDDPDTTIRSWGVFGGTPYYLRTLTPAKSLEENIQTHILSEHGVLHNEPEFLLRTEFGIRQPHTYYTILRAIATGKREANEIAGFAGIDSNTLGSYLSKLRRLRLIERDIPVTANPNSTRRSRYRLTEPLFRFWFRYVYGQEENLIRLGDSAYEQLVKPSFSDYMGPMFETVCQDVLPTLIPKTYQGIGYWWHREHEIDVVGLANDGTLIAGECKYTTRAMTAADLADLERSAAEIQWTSPTDGEPTVRYCCFSRSGFSDGLRALEKDRDDVLLFTLAEVIS